MQIIRTNAIGRHIETRLVVAKKSVYICSPYISEQYAQKLVWIAKRGAIVRVLTSDKIIENDFFIGRFFKAAKAEKALNSLRTLVLKHRGNSFEHSKLYIFDDEYAAAGSANLTRPGMWEHYETMSVTETSEEVQQIKLIFDKAWQDALTSTFGSSAVV